LESEKVIKTTKAVMIVNLAVGIALVVLSLVLTGLKIEFLSNQRAIVGISFIPFGIALASFLSLYFMRRDPKGPLVTYERDERIQAIRYETDSKAFRVLRWALMLFYFGYTFIVPNDIFEAPGWWVTLGFFFMSFMLPGILFKVALGKEQKDE